MTFSTTLCSLMVGLVLGHSAIAGAQATEHAVRVVNAPEQVVILEGENYSGKSSVSLALQAELELFESGEIVKVLVDEVESPECDIRNNELWKKYYNPSASKKQKIEVLKQIQGLEDGDAEQLYYYWPEVRPPANWYEFWYFIGGAELEHIPQLHTKVVLQTAANREHFGYSVDCEDMVTYKMVNVREVLQKKPKGTKSVNVHIEVEGGVLLVDELEVIRVAYDGELKVAVDSEYNTYDIEHALTDSGEYKVKLHGKRIKTFPKNQFSKANIIIESGVVFLELKREDADLDAIYGGELSVEFELFTKRRLIKKNKLTDAYNMPFHRSRVVGTRGVPMATGYVSIDTGYRVDKSDVSIYIEYRTFHTGSAFFSNAKSFFDKTPVLNPFD